MKMELPEHLHRYEDYVDQHYKEFLKNQGKVDSVRLAELAGGRMQGETHKIDSLPLLSLMSSLFSCNSVFH